MKLILSGTSEALKSYGALKLFAVATKTSIELEKKQISLEDLMKLCPLSKGLALTLPDEKTIIGGTSTNLIRVLVSLIPGSGLYGKNEFEVAEIDSWISYTSSSIEIIVDAMKTSKASGISDDKLFNSIASDLAYPISVINCHVMYSTYMVGDSLTSADISIGCSLYEAASLSLWNPDTDDEKTVNIRRWYNTIVNQDFFITALKVTTSATGLIRKQSSSSDSTTLNGYAPPVVNKLFKRNRIRVKEILEDDGAKYLGKIVTVCGWARTTRNAGRLMFIELNDGSIGTSLQCTCESGTTEGFDESKKSGGTGASFQITGTVVESPAAGQAVELKVSECKLLGAVYGGDAEGKTVGGMLYPMAKKAHTLEYMRENAHLRPRASLHSAVMRIRHSMAYATHKFFHDNGFLYIHTPIITCADCEGAGEQFGVTNMLGNDHLKPDVKLSYHEAPKEIVVEGEEKKLSKNEMKRLAKQAAKASQKEATSDFGKPEDVKVIGAVDYSKDFFGRRANLTVSGQLNVETHACALSDVYTFGPTFRAENSHTSRHLAEFWMIEPEIAFADLNDDINLAEDYLKYCVKYALEMCSTDLEFLETSPYGEVGLRDRLHNVLNNAFKRLTYTEAIEILQKAYNDDKVPFEVKPEWGIDLPSEHERFLCEKVFKKPVVLMNYPKEIKAFYMKLDDDGRTVSAADILVPKIGEIIGGSQREHRTDVLVQRCKDMGLDPRSVWWYIDLRKFGTVPHAGFGLGFERLILFITGLDNIRDVIPFPRWAGNAEF